MTIELALTPAGHIRVAAAEDGSGADAQASDPSSPNGQMRGILQAFSDSQSEGLFVLAAERIDGESTPSLAYWRDFARRYLNELCHTPESEEKKLDAISPPASGELATMLLSVPPMQGAEYVSAAALEGIWSGLDTWVRGQIASCRDGLSGFLRRRAPMWHRVGRVSFHLAENRRDPDFPFAFLATYTPSVASSGRVRYQPLSKALQQYAGAKNKKALIKLLSPVHLASQRSSLVKDLVESGDIYQPLAWTPGDAYRFLKDVSALEESGVLVRLPDWWKKRPRPQVSVTIGGKRQNHLGASSLLDFKVQLALGDQTLSEAEWRELMAAQESGLVLLKGQWVEVDREKLTEALEHWKRVEQQADGGLSFIEGMRLLAGAPRDLSDEEPHDESQRQWSFVEAGKWLADILENLRRPETLKQARPGRDLKTTLRPYQAVGVNWLWFMSSLGLGACLADDMGLGKTVQLLALLLVWKRQAGCRPSLLVLPASLLGNWKTEIGRFAPGLRARLVHPSEMEKEEFVRLAAEPDVAVENVDVVLTTYGMLLRHTWLLDVEWRLAVLDEAQAIKNPSARQTRTVKRLKADTRIALTGTPLENRVSDLWSLFDFLCPGLLGSQAKFKDFVKNLESRTSHRYAPLRGLVQPYILRRLKTDKQIIADLPDKTEVRAYCGLSKRQASLYAKLVRELADSLNGVDGMKRRGLVLSYLMRFKQVCNHPSQLLGDGDYDQAASGKFLRLGEICGELASRQEKALVFTQYREMTEPLSAYLCGVFARGGLVLHGGTPVKRRKKLVDEFQREDGPPFFVLSLKAGGTGLNLTAASHVIHFDRWWNPAVENQATDRAFRIGQHRNVLVHKFVCQGTIEERIDTLIEEKTQLATELLEGGTERMLTEMTDQELLKLVSLDIERARL